LQPIRALAAIMNSYMPGDMVLWKYVVTDCGNVPLSNIIVTDNNGTLGNQDDDWSPTYISGDTSNVGFLDLTETWIYGLWVHHPTGATHYANETMKIDLNSLFLQ
jgi:hypothetical protein